MWLGRVHGDHGTWGPGRGTTGLDQSRIGGTEKEEEWMNPGEAGSEDVHDNDMMGELEVDDLDSKGSHHTLLFP